MQVGTGKSILNGIAIGKLKLYKKKDAVISAADVTDTAAEEARFEDARAKAIDQQTALYEKALDEAGEDIAEVFNIHAMMLDDDDFVDAIKEIINKHVFIPLLCIRHNILDRVSMIKAFAYFRDHVFPAFSCRFFRLNNICVLFSKPA